MFFLVELISRVDLSYCLTILYAAGMCTRCSVLLDPLDSIARAVASALLCYAWCLVPVIKNVHVRIFRSIQYTRVVAL